MSEFEFEKIRKWIFEINEIAYSISNLLSENKYGDKAVQYFIVWYLITLKRYNLRRYQYLLDLVSIISVKLEDIKNDMEGGI